MIGRVVKAVFITVSCVVMSWVPMMFAIMDSWPGIIGPIERNVALVIVAFRQAVGWRKILLVGIVLVLSLVLAVVVLLDAVPILARNANLQMRIWINEHIDNL